MINTRTLLVLFLMAGYLVISMLFHVSEQDLQDYKLLPLNQDTQEKNKGYSGRQERSGVRRDIWYSDAEQAQRLHFVILGKESQVLFDTESNKDQIIEEIQDVHCFMQEDLYYLLPDDQAIIRHANGEYFYSHSKQAMTPPDVPLRAMQHLRYLQADAATYSYTDNLFTAKTVALARYTLPSHTLKEDLTALTPELEGAAQTVQFSLEGSDLNFHAERLRVKIHSMPGSES